VDSERLSLSTYDIGRDDVRARARTVFAQVMFLVAANCGFTAAGAYIGRDLSRGASLVCLLGGLAVAIGLGFVRKRSSSLALTLFFGFGLLLGLGVGPLLNAYATVNGSAILWQAAGATALFVGAFGAYGYATRRDLTSWARTLFWSLLGLIVLGLVLVFVSIPYGHLIYALLGLGIFAAFTMFDFNRLRRAQPDDAVLIATGIYLDVFNVFLFMLSILGGGDRR
jgi:FtsH-binding integral membrane protein